MSVLVPVHSTVYTPASTGHCRRPFMEFFTDLDCSKRGLRMAFNDLALAGGHALFILSSAFGWWWPRSSAATPEAP